MAYRQYKLTSLAQRMWMGKYKGMTIGDLLVKDMTYCKWLFNLPNVHVDISVLRAKDQLEWYSC